MASLFGATKLAPDKCRECPYFRHVDNSADYATFDYCAKKPEAPDIEDPESIPDWCPLRDGA